MKMYTLLTLSLLVLSVSCSSAKKRNVKIESNPAADVYLLNDQFSDSKKLGTSPLDFDLDQNQNAKFYYLSFQQEGYEEFKVVIPKTWDLGVLNVNLKQLEKYTQPELKNLVIKEVEELHVQQVMSILKTQRLLMQEDFSGASREIAKLYSLKAPEAITSILEGNLEYLRGNARQALAKYRKALTYDPSNEDLLSIVALIEGRAPAGERR